MIRNCCRKKHEIRIHELLSNGQHLNIYFEKHNTGTNHERITAVWTIGVCISDTRKQANHWWNGKNKRNLQQTGKCGLEGLRRTAEILKELIPHLGFHEELQVGWEDEKRRRAYRYLLRYGFLEFEDCYAIRNPEIWEWKTGSA